MAEGLRAAIVGCGSIAGGYDRDESSATVLSHAGAYRRHDGFELIVCVEPDTARRRAFMDRWNIEHGFGAIGEWRDSGVDCDVASLCSPSPGHAAALMQLLELPLRGVFCEKPLATDLAAGEAAVAAYRNANRALQVNYSRRWDTSMQSLKQQIDDGDWGRIYGANGFYNKGLLNNGSHLIDLLGYLLGALEIVGVTGRRSGHGACDPTLDLVLDCAATSGSGDTVPVHLLGGEAGGYALFELRIATEKGVIDIENSGFSIRERRPEPSALFPGYRHLGCGVSRDTGLGGAMLKAAENFHGAVTRGETIVSDGNSALAALRVCEDALRRAAGARGGTV